MFKKLNIKNFKVLKDFICDDLKPINTFSGKNNCGKSTLLEGIFLLSGCSNAASLVVDSIFPLNRKMIINQSRDLSFLFSQLDFSKKISFNGTFKTDRVSVNCSPILEGNKKINGLNIEYKYNNKSSGKNQIVYNPQKTQLSVPGLTIEQQSPFVITMKDNKPSKFISAKFLNSESSTAIKEVLEVIRTGNKDKFLKVLNDLFDEKVIDIFQAENMIDVFLKGVKESIPLNLLGGGVNRVVPLLSSSASPAYQLLLVDEIENGLHHSIMKPILKVLFQEIIRGKKQIFITTHSKDILKAVAEVIQNNEDFLDNYRHHSLVRKNDTVRCYTYNSEEFLTTISTSIDVRN